MFSQPTNYSLWGCQTKNLYHIPSALFCALILPNRYLSILSFSLEICGILGTSTANAIATRAMK